MSQPDRPTPREILARARRDGEGIRDEISLQLTGGSVYANIMRSVVEMSDVDPEDPGTATAVGFPSDGAVVVLLDDDQEDQYP